MTSQLVKFLSSFEHELRNFTGTGPYDGSSNREIAAALVAALRSTETILMDRLDDDSLARTLHELREWVEDMSKGLRERRLRDPEFHFLLEARCSELRLPGPDSQGPFCLILVGLPDRDLLYVEWLLGDGYRVEKYRIEGQKAHGPSVWHLGSALDGLEGQLVHIVEVA